jgi:hypothetical protein
MDKLHKLSDSVLKVTEIVKKNLPGKQTENLDVHSQYNFKYCGWQMYLKLENTIYTAWVKMFNFKPNFWFSNTTNNFCNKFKAKKSLY